MDEKSKADAAAAAAAKKKLAGNSAAADGSDALAGIDLSELGEVKGFKFDVLVKRKPQLVQELMTFRDVLMSSDEEESIKVSWGRGGRDLALDLCQDLCVCARLMHHVRRCATVMCGKDVQLLPVVHLQVWDVKDAGLQAASRVAAASDPLALLAEISQNFPSIVSSLTRQQVRPGARGLMQATAAVTAMRNLVCHSVRHSSSCSSPLFDALTCSLCIAVCMLCCV
jgi:UDP-glucose:glycoprotein glucosyltransferase